MLVRYISYILSQKPSAVNQILLLTDRYSCCDDMWRTFDQKMYAIGGKSRIIYTIQREAHPD